ncbi:MAG: LysE family translocator [Pseudomonadales bacterium]
MSYESLSVFIFTLFAVSIVPGPSMMLALTHGVRYGARQTLATAAGNTLASALQASVSALGLGVIIATSAALFAAIKVAGALYLIYLGYKMLRAARWEHLNAKTHVQQRAPLGHLFKQGFLVAIGNPKAIVFFSALFPQFIDPALGGVGYYSAMVALTASSAFCCAMLYALGGQQIATVFTGSAFGRYFNKVSGGFFIGGGVALAMSQR